MYGQQAWWPAETRDEIIIGAFLTQNTNWHNVELALAALRTANALSLAAISRIDEQTLQELVRPTGFYRQKAAYLKGFAELLEQHFGGSLDALFGSENPRKLLLQQKGIGPETADAILLYAGNTASFVVDAYTRRIFSRLGHCNSNVSYETLRALFMEGLESDVVLFQQYHALIVSHCKQRCLKRNPLCADCTLRAACSVVEVN